MIDLQKICENSKIFLRISSFLKLQSLLNFIVATKRTRALRRLLYTPVDYSSKDEKQYDVRFQKWCLKMRLRFSNRLFRIHILDTWKDFKPAHFCYFDAFFHFFSNPNVANLENSQFSEFVNFIIQHSDFNKKLVNSCCQKCQKIERFSVFIPILNSNCSVVQFRVFYNLISKLLVANSELQQTCVDTVEFQYDCCVLGSGDLFCEFFTTWKQDYEYVLILALNHDFEFLENTFCTKTIFAHPDIFCSTNTIHFLLSWLKSRIKGIENIGHYLRKNVNSFLSLVNYFYEHGAKLYFRKAELMDIGNIIIAVCSHLKKPKIFLKRVLKDLIISKEFCRSILRVLVDNKDTRQMKYMLRLIFKEKRYFDEINETINLCIANNLFQHLSVILPFFRNNESYNERLHDFYDEFKSGDFESYGFVRNESSQLLFDFLYSDVSKRRKIDDVCFLCLREIKNPMNLTCECKKPCCYSCVKNLVSSKLFNNSCPLCRQILMSETKYVRVNI